ncbi:MAG: hypothetical protein JXB14_07890, partial [Candidatus Altiarchaeota archaeon]|nr:hypothetical protein [Candidatus Altiarchaeota archaeon]
YDGPTPLYDKAYSMPSCHDGLKNGDEAGVDCGGACLNSCGGGCSTNLECTDSDMCTYDLCKDSACVNKDANLDGGMNIGLGDIIQVIGKWATADQAADIDSSGNVGLSDIIAIIGLWANSCLP